jgi:hypothetical protein
MEAATWEVNLHTGRWTAARHRGTFPLPAIGDKVRADPSCDAREWDELKRRLGEEGRGLDWSDTDGRWNVYVVVALASDA